MKTQDGDIIEIGDKVRFSHAGGEGHGKIIGFIEGTICVRTINGYTQEIKTFIVPLSDIWIEKF